MSGAAALAEVTNALMIPQRSRDLQRSFYAEKVGGGREQAYVTAEARDLKSISEGRRSAGRDLRRLSPALWT
jgi:hypothetical protein